MEALRASLEKKPAASPRSKPPRRRGRAEAPQAARSARRPASPRRPRRARRPRPKLQPGSSHASLRRSRRRAAAAPSAQHDPRAGRARASSRPRAAPRNALRFSFQDLIVLRTAQALVKARVPQRRIAPRDEGAAPRRRSRDSTCSPSAAESPAPAAFRIAAAACAAPDAPTTGSRGAGARGRGHRLGRARLPPGDRGRSVAPRRVDQPGLAAARGGHAERGREDLPRGARRRAPRSVLLFNLGVLLEDMRRRREAIAGLRGGGARGPGGSPTRTTIWRCSREARQAARGDPAHGAVPPPQRSATLSTSLPVFSPLEELEQRLGERLEALDDVLARLELARRHPAGHLARRLARSGRRSRTPPCPSCCARFTSSDR